MTDLHDPPEASRRRLLIQHWGAILWPSFIAAGLASMVFFAFVDPLALRDMTFPELPITRKLGYTLGFFMFWIATASASLFTSILLSPGSRFNRPLSGD